MLFCKHKKDLPQISAIIVAAGNASRMHGIDKQYAQIGNLPVIVRSVQQFDDCPLINEIILVCRESDIASYYAIVRDFGFKKISQIVAGGNERQDSVFRGIDACSTNADFFAIHDGARPLVTAEIIAECIDAAIKHGAAAAGVPVKDTIKQVRTDGSIAETPDRSKLVAIQTPQIFAAQLYRSAMALAIKQGHHYTDDCQLIENSGHCVFVSCGSYSNIKITTPEDLEIAEALLNYYEEEVK